jgi:hypothetical protein
MFPPESKKPVMSSLATPAIPDIERITNVTQPVLRNLLITQCYYELSTVFTVRTGPCANWCTFAVWASKQAGQTIRREDLVRTLEGLLRKEPEVEAALFLIAQLAKRSGARQTLEQIRSSALGTIVIRVADKAGEAVSRGNKKVFEEIARQFARFMATCFTDHEYSKVQIEEFCSQLVGGLPPGGQEYLKRAFTRYYESFFETDIKKQAELRLLANLEIGFHEQTRLQPEIAASLNAAMIDLPAVKTHLLKILFPNTDYIGRIWFFVQSFFHKTELLDKAIESLVLKAQYHLRRILTLQLMTLTLPPDNCLRLGQDLATTFPANFVVLAHPDLLVLLKQIDPTNNSVSETGATDWADLPERLHFIADLFRCYHETKDLFCAPFTDEQVKAMKEGRIPAGRL